MAIWLRLHRGVSAETWAANAAKLGLSVLRGLHFELDTIHSPEAFRLGFANLEEKELTRYLDFYNCRRPHSSLDGGTPDQAYFNPPPIRIAA